MKIALINENSQAAKNALIEATLRKVVEPMGHEVVNYGMYAACSASATARATPRSALSPSSATRRSWTACAPLPSATCPTS